MTSEHITERVKNQFGDGLVDAFETYGMLTLVIKPEINIEVLKFLKDESDLAFGFLKDECGIHYPFNKDEELGVIYLLHNLRANVQVRVKTFFPSDKPVIRSATSLWAAANWMERETYDFFGIKFEGHPDLRRILNVDDMDYFPMLKQYPLEDGTREDKDDKMFGRG